MAEQPDITLEFHGQKYPLYLADGIKSLQESSAEESTFNARFSSGKKKYGDDPILNLAEWRDWVGGRGGKNFDDDNTQYFDSNAWTLSPGMVVPAPQWQIAKGLRSEDRNLPGNVSWKQVLDSQKFISTPFTASSSYSVSTIWLFVRRVGTPATLTVSIYTDISGNPGSALCNVNLDTGDVTDYLSVYKNLTLDSPLAIVSGTTYHIVLHASDDDTGENHWEIGVNEEAPGSLVSTMDSNFSNGLFLMYYRLTDADASHGFTFFDYKNDTYLVTKPATGTSLLYKFATDTFSTTGLGTQNKFHVVSGRPLVSKKAVYFPQGESDPICRWNGTTTWDDDGANKASMLINSIDETDGGKIWRANIAADNASTTVSKSGMKNWGTDLDFGTAVHCGDPNYPITNMLMHQNKLWIFKQDQIGIVASDKYSLQESNLKYSPSARNGAAVCSFNGLMYYSWLNTLMESYGGNANDVGQAWRGKGPSVERVGYVSCLLGVGGWRICGIDAGATGYSSVQIYNGTTWHEIYRAPYGHRIRDIWWMAVDGSRSKLFIDIDYDVVYMEFPRDVAAPTNDPTFNYSHSFYLTTSSFDDGAARLAKYLKSITVSTSNLTDPTGETNAYIEVDYQTDNDVGEDGADHWFYVGRIFTSPEGTLKINAGNVRVVRFRFRGYTNRSTVPPKIDAVTLDGFTRTPARTIWTMTIQVGESGPFKKKSSEILKFLQEVSTSADDVTVESKIPELNGRHVIITRPRVSRMSLLKEAWTGTMVVSVMDMDE